MAPPLTILATRWRHLTTPHGRDTNRIFFLSNQVFVWHGGHLILSVSLIESIFVLHALLLTQYITGKFQIKIFLPNGCDVITDSQSEQIFLDFLNKFSISLIVSQIFKSIFLLSCSVSVKETQIWLDWCGWNNYSDRPFVEVTAQVPWMVQ